MSCKKCGACCKYTAVMIGQPDEDGVRWSAYHGHRLFEKEGQLVVFIPNRCSQLGDDNLCKIYKDRPNVCATVPNVDCTIFQPPECGYFNENSGE